MSAAAILTLVQILAALVSADYALIRITEVAQHHGGFEAIGADLLEDIRGRPEELEVLKASHPDLHAAAVQALTAATPAQVGAAAP